jgi:hypothetical protein
MAKRARKSRAGAGKKRASRPARPSPDAQDAADLRKLIEALIAAKQRGDTAAQDEATQGLIDFMMLPVSQALRNAAEEARLQADNQVMAESLEALRGIAARMAAAGPGLEAAAAIAAEGAKKLLFPRLAKSAQTMLEAVEELKQATDALKAQLDDVKELGDLPKLLDNLAAQLQRLRARAETLQA